MNEERRLATLKLYDLLDTASEEAFDRLTELAAEVCDMPISLVSLIDEDRQWFKSNRGLDVDETPREQAFCDHAIRQNEILMIEDAQTDIRFRDNPLVVSKPGIRFYAGAPLKMNSGENIGTLCVIDNERRKLTEAQLRSLGTIRDAVTALIELRRASRQLADIEKLLPLCAWCGDVRVESGDWRDLQSYVAEAVPLTHTICPKCYEIEAPGSA